MGMREFLVRCILFCGIATSIFLTSASAEERLIMPFACQASGGRVNLIPAPRQSYRIFGTPEHRMFTACSPNRPELCRGLLAVGSGRAHEVGPQPGVGQRRSAAYENGFLVERRATRTVLHGTAVRLWALDIWPCWLRLALRADVSQQPTIHRRFADGLRPRARHLRPVRIYTGDQRDDHRSIWKRGPSRRQPKQCDLPDYPQCEGARRRAAGAALQNRSSR
jgi:hypothetical protein